MRLCISTYTCTRSSCKVSRAKLVALKKDNKKKQYTQFLFCCVVFFFLHSLYSCSIVVALPIYIYIYIHMYTYLFLFLLFFCCVFVLSCLVLMNRALMFVATGRIFNDFVVLNVCVF